LNENAQTPPSPDADESPRDAAPAGRSVLFGLGLDATDRHTRLTRSQSPEFLLWGGSMRTHEHMTEKVLAFHAALARTGRRLEELSASEYYELVRQIGDSPWSWWFANRPYPFWLPGGKG
jgi:hypothetical protein